MQKYKVKTKLAALLAVFFSLTSAGCSSGGGSSSIELPTFEAEDTTEATQGTSAETTTRKLAVTTEPQTVKATEPAPAKTGSMPVISINTKNTASSALRFVTEPIAGHVSHAISTWTPGYVIPPEPYYEACTITVTDTDSTVLLDSEEADVKVRGNWTTTYDKKPLRIKFSQKQSMLGLNDGAECKNWVLLAEYKDYSMLRDKTALSIAREILGSDGLYASDAALAEVYINGNYWGVYLLTEFQQVNSDRVDITKPKDGYGGTDIGYFLEFDGYYSNEDALHSFLPDYHGNAPLSPYDGNDGSGRKVKCLSDGSNPYKEDVGITIKSDINSPEQRDFIENYINGVYAIMYNAAYYGEAYVFTDDMKTIKEAPEMSPEDAVKAVVDVDSLADSYILNELFCDADLYWSSFFMDVDFGEGGSKKLRFEAPWDFDSALGNKDRCADAQGFYAANELYDVNDTYISVNPWLTVLMYEDWFQNIIKDKWTAAYDGGVITRALDDISSDSTVHEKAFADNYKKWRNNTTTSDVSSELCYKALHCSTEKEAADYLADWLSKRAGFMNEHWHK